jgi:methionyl-tRNA formyltransferase
MLRIVFAGTPQFALPTLEALASSSHTLVGVLTQPDRPAGRGRALHASAVKQRAQQLGLLIAQPAELKSAGAREGLRAWAPDLMVVAAYGLILPPPVLSLPRLGCINVHASLLPRWRGAAPIERAILAGDHESGISIMQMEAGLDTGPVFTSAPVPIGAATTAGELHDVLAQLGARLLLDTVNALTAGQTRAQPQSEHGVTYAPKITRADARIDWGGSAALIDLQVRALNPWPVAETLWHGAQLRIWGAEPLESSAGAAEERPPQSDAPGTIVGLDSDGLHVLCGSGLLRVRRVQLPGRRVVSAREFANAARPIGSQLGV